MKILIKLKLISYKYLNIIDLQMIYLQGSIKKFQNCRVDSKPIFTLKTPRSLNTYFVGIYKLKKIRLNARTQKYFYIFDSSVRQKKQQKLSLVELQRCLACT